DLLKEYEPHIHPIQIHINEHSKSINEALNSYSPLQLIIFTAIITSIVLWFYNFIFNNDEDIKVRLLQTIFRLLRRIPVIQRKIAQTKTNTLTSVYSDLAKSIHGHNFSTALPPKGLSEEDLITKLREYKDLEHIKYRNGRVSGCVYSVEKNDLTSIYCEILKLFGATNPLHADVFPDIRTMEAECVRMVATMFHGGPECCGTMTSGGTESLLMACKTYRDLALSKGIKRPEM
ncbi:unnamed protein product, partial [Didymodactylos carnosus]